jgi:hypothetical protein
VAQATSENFDALFTAVVAQNQESSDHEMPKSLEQTLWPLYWLIFCFDACSSCRRLTNFAAVLRDNPGNLQSLLKRGMDANTSRKARQA